jgi:serine/threonine protein kinase
MTFPASGGYCPNDGTRIASAEPAARDDLIGRTLDGRYEIREPLAAPRPGAIGVMYKGFQTSVSREVALKIVHPQYAVDHDAIARFMYAGRAAAQLVAPAIANVYDVGRTSDGTLYVVSELVRGRSLLEHLGRAMVVRRVVGLALQLVDGLAAIHTANLAHGDLDPANIMLDDTRDQLKLLDVGLSCALVPPRPGYAAPERLDGQPQDARSDLYAVGVMLYELLTGTPLFAAASPEALAGKHRHEKPPQLPPHIPPSLDAIVQRLLSKSPTARQGTAIELRGALASVQDIVGLPSNPAIALPRTASADYGQPQLPRTASADYSNLQLPRTASADDGQPQLPRTASADYSNPQLPRANSRDLASGPATFGTPYPAAPSAPAPTRSRRWIVIVLVALIASGAGIATILFVA